MNKALLLLLALPCTVLAQDISWEKSYGGRQADYLFDLQPTADYGFILAGSSLSQKTGTKDSKGSGNLDYWIWKMDESGALDWQQSFGGSGSDLLKSVRLTGDGGFILGGTSNSTIVKGTMASDVAEGGKNEASRGGNDFWIIKLDAKGHEVWQRTLGGSAQDDILAVVPTRDGGYLAGGSSASEDNGDKTSRSRGNMDYWIVKLDKDGKTQWQQTFGGPYADLLRAMQATTDGGYILGGYSNSPSGAGGKQINDKSQDNYGEGGDYWILKLDKDGKIQWQQAFGGDGDEQLFALVQTRDNKYLVGGSSASGATGNKNKTNRSGSDIWLLELDENGNTTWQQTYDFGKGDFLCSIVENDDHTFLLGGYAKSEGTKDDEGINDYIAFKIDAKGEELWRKTVGSEGEDILSKVVETRDGGYLLAGTSNPEAPRYDASGNTQKGKNNVKVGNSGNIAALDNAQQSANEAINKAANDANTAVNKTVNEATGKVNDAIANANPDDRIKVGGIGTSGNILNPGQNGGNTLDKIGDSWKDKGPKEGLHASREKKTNYGDRDFWVVKLKDKDKKVKERKSIEAFPNPTSQYSNVVVSFDFTKGSLSVYDISGHQLQQFDISERTVPVDFSGYPEGIYIVSVKTDKGEGSVKVMKGVK